MDETAEEKHARRERKAARRAAREAAAASAPPADLKKARTDSAADGDGASARGGAGEPVGGFAEARARFPAAFAKVFDAATRGFEKPSEIQARVWGSLLDGRDVVGIASTGSGKTLAFTLPCLARLMSKERKHHSKSGGSSPVRAHALVLAPTRELCLQNHAVAQACCDATGGLVSSCVVYGGQSRQDQLKELQRVAARSASGGGGGGGGGGALLLLATTGRLLDFVDAGEVNLAKCEFLVLDEADRMLDMGFEKDVRRILAVSPPSDQRQTLMFSATWPTEIRAIANEFLKEDFVKVVVGGEDLKAASTVEQLVTVMEPRDKDQALLRVLRERHKGNRVIVFALYKKEAERVERMLRQQRFSVVGAHGDKSQADREAAVRAFTKGDALILVATDVASRGLDIKGVELVINYTFPLTIEDYVHRIGRTGRAGRSGVAVTFFTSEDKIRAGELQNVLRAAGATVPPELMAFGGTVKKKEHAMYGAHFRPTAEGEKAAPTKVTFSDSDDD